MSWDNFTDNQCDRMQINYMGIDADPLQTGNFYLQTNSKVDSTFYHELEMTLDNSRHHSIVV